VNAALKDQLYHRVTRATSTAARAVELSRETAERTQTTTKAARRARRLRWSIRYEQAFMKNSRKLSELDRPAD
jgi:hypothetical protein